MTNTDARLARLVARQHGATSHSQCNEAGLTDRQIEWRLGNAILLAVHEGVYHHAACPQTRGSRLMAAVLAAGSTAVASRRSAARLWALRDLPRHRPEISLPGRRLPVVAGADVHRLTRLSPADITQVRGFPCTSVALTLLDLGAVLPAMVMTAAEDAVIDNKVTPVQLACVFGTGGPPGQAGYRDPPGHRRDLPATGAA